MIYYYTHISCQLHQLAQPDVKVISQYIVQSWSCTLVNSRFGASPLYSSLWLV